MNNSTHYQFVNLLVQYSTLELQDHQNISLNQQHQLRQQHEAIMMHLASESLQAQAAALECKSSSHNEDSDLDRKCFDNKSWILHFLVWG
jgi:hypothetical protein